MDDRTRQTPALKEQDLTGFRFVKRVLPMVARLHGQGCRRDKAHNRTLHFDDYAAFCL